jgi:transcriptional regulator with GAF, ATPase, and Fis domain
MAMAQAEYPIGYHPDVSVARLGSLESRPFDVTVIATTKRDPQTEILAGRFRRELFYRLSSVEVRVPPLRDRKEDMTYFAGRARDEIRMKLLPTVSTPGGVSHLPVTITLIRSRSSAS